MPEFLVHFDINPPYGMPAEEFERHLAEEKEAAAPFFSNRTFTRVWRVPGQLGHIAIWRAPDADYVHRAYASFPLFRLNIGRATVTALAVNPNDPGQPASVPEGWRLHGKPLTYPVLRAHLDEAKANGWNTSMENGIEIAPGVSIHDHPGSDRGRQIHFMVDGQKLAELGPREDEGEAIGAGYVDFLAEWFGRPVIHDQWRARIAADNNLVHGDYASAFAAPRQRHHALGDENGAM